MHEAEDCVRRLNAAWQQADWAAVSDCLDPNVIMLLPDGGQLLRGRDEMLASYREFVEMATVHRLDIARVEVFDFQSTVMCHMHFELQYAFDEEREEAEGLEVYALRADAPGGLLRVVWRMQQLFGEVPVISLDEMDDDGD